MEVEVMDRKESFIEMVAKDDPEYKKVLKSIVDRKTEKSASKKEIAEITKDILSSEAIKFEDGSGVTFGEMVVASAVANSLKKENNTSFKELADLQKVVGESAEADMGVVINVITNGQDLGE